MSHARCLTLTFGIGIVMPIFSARVEYRVCLWYVGACWSVLICCSSYAGDLRHVDVAYLTTYGRTSFHACNASYIWFHDTDHIFLCQETCCRKNVALLDVDSWKHSENRTLYSNFCTPNKSQSHSNRRNIEVSGNNDKQICWQGHGCYGHPTSDCNSYTKIPFVWTSIFSESCQKDGNKVRQLQHWSNTVFSNFKPLNCLKQCLQFGSHSLQQERQSQNQPTCCNSGSKTDPVLPRWWVHQCESKVHVEWQHFIQSAWEWPKLLQMSISWLYRNSLS